MIDSTYTLQATIRSHPKLGLAYIDDGRPLEGRSYNDRVGVVMARDQIDGERAGSSSLGYDTLAEAIRATADESGVATAKQIAKFLADQGGVSKSTMTVGGVTKHGKLAHVSTVPACPPGLTHPVVDYAFRLMPDSIQVEYKVSKGVEIIADEQVAILDNDGNGKPEPEHDSLLTYNAQSRESATEFVGNIVPFERLQQALSDLGGQADEAALRDRFSKLTMQPGQNFDVSAFSPSPDPLATCDRVVEKTFRQTPSGTIFVDFRLTDRDSIRGGWNG